MSPDTLLDALLQAGLFGTQLGQLLIVLIGVLVVVLVGRLVLRIAWRVVTIGVVLVAGLLLLTTFGPV